MPSLSGTSSGPEQGSIWRAWLWQPFAPGEALHCCPGASVLRACGALGSSPSPLPRPDPGPFPSPLAPGLLLQLRRPSLPVLGRAGQGSARPWGSLPEGPGRGRGRLAAPRQGEMESPTSVGGGLLQLNATVEDQQSQALHPPAGTPVPRPHGDGRQGLPRAPFAGRQHAPRPVAAAAGRVSTGCSVGHSPPELCLVQHSPRGLLSGLRAFVPSAAAWPCYSSFLSPTGLALHSRHHPPLQTQDPAIPGAGDGAPHPVLCRAGPGDQPRSCGGAACLPPLHSAATQ